MKVIPSVPLRYVEILRRNQLGSRPTLSSLSGATIQSNMARVRFSLGEVRRERVICLMARRINSHGRPATEEQATQPR